MSDVSRPRKRTKLQATNITQNEVTIETRAVYKQRKAYAMAALHNLFHYCHFNEEWSCCWDDVNNLAILCVTWKSFAKYIPRVTHCQCEQYPITLRGTHRKCFGTIFERIGLAAPHRSRAMEKELRNIFDLPIHRQDKKLILEQVSFYHHKNWVVRSSQNLSKWIFPSGLENHYYVMKKGKLIQKSFSHPTSIQESFVKFVK